MTLDKFLGTKPPKYWKPPIRKVDSKCWFNDEVVRVLGLETSCFDPSQGYCDGECTWGPHCEDCSTPRICTTDLCAGRTLLCLNPNCPTDK